MGGIQFILGMVFWACLVAPSSFADDKGYRYRGDHAQAVLPGKTRQEFYCMTERRSRGLNPGYFGECGDLARERLSGAELRWAKVPLASFYMAKLDSTDLTGADLWMASLYRADVRGAQLKWAHLFGARLEEADLRNANLRGADLREASLAGAQLEGADLTGAHYNVATVFPEGWNCGNTAILCNEAAQRGMIWVPDKISLSPIPANREIVDQCAGRVPVGKEESVSEFDMRRVRKTGWYQPDRYSGGWAIYRVSRQQDGIHLSMKLRFDIGPGSVSDERASEMLARSRACIPGIQSLWGQYGVIFDLEMDSDREPSLDFVDRSIDLTDKEGRSNTREFFFQGFGPRDNFCATMAHEFGHYLGLPDEYQDRKRPDREYFSTRVFPWSMMDHHGLSPKHHFFPEHLAKVLEPLCGKL